jgi:uncharacterized repeat protein (TIGR01451 family)
MKIISKVSIIMLVAAFVVGPAGSTAVLAATTPSLGTAATFGVLSGTYINTVVGTTITGDLGYTTGPASVPTVSGSTHTDISGVPAGDIYQQAGTAQTNALANLNAQVLAGCTSLGVGAVNLNNVAGHLTGVYTPGCYTSGGAMNITTGTTVTLNGAGTYIFKPGGALTTEADTSVVLAGGASACDVFWIPVGGTTLGAYTGALPNTTREFVGNIFRGDAAGLSITIGQFTDVLGRLLAYGSTVTTDKNIITVPTCAAAVVPPPSIPAKNYNTITVIKHIINDNGGTATSFPLFVSGTPVFSGGATPLAPGMYTVTETSNPNYTTTFSGDCNASGVINHGGIDTHNDTCVITNDDIGAPVVPPVPPLIDVVKVPNPLSLPAGPGAVTYTYTLRNIGTVPVTNITMVGDTCSPITLISGDTNSDSKLDMTETWTYRCSTNLTETHTNTVTATGWANGISATDVASAKVVVGLPIVPPLIHVTKTPSPLTLSAGGGMVTYTKKVTNPGTVALSNVLLTDDKCSPLTYVSGDTNSDSKLDVIETWTYTCRTNLTKTTVNTVFASGEANGLTARDSAIATVVVAAPKLPNTGIAPDGNNILWNIILGALMLASVSLVVVLRKRMI